MTAFARAHSTITPALVLALGLAACDRPAPETDASSVPMPQVESGVSETPAAEADPAPAAPPSAPSAVPAQTPAKPAPPTTTPQPPAAAPARWDVSRTADGATATYLDAEGPILRVTCTSGPARLRVNVPSFRPIGSEDRLSVGFGNNPIALVASRAGGGGVTAVGELPPNIAARVLRAPTIAASYGNQTVGPFVAPRGADAMTFANACEEAVSPTPARPGPALPGERRREQIPVNFRGEWNTRLQDCGTGRNDSALTVAARTLRFYESHGEVTAVTRDGPRAISVEARYRGEGETWNRTIRMSLSGDLSRLTIDGVTRRRCPSDAATDQTRPRRAP